MKKFLIGGVVAGVIAIIIVVTSVFTGGSDKFVGTWYRVDRTWNTCIEEVTIKQNGNDYTITATRYNFGTQPYKWEQGKIETYVASKSDGYLIIDYDGSSLPIMYNKANETIIINNEEYKKVNIQELKAEVEQSYKKK